MGLTDRINEILINHGLKKPPAPPPEPEPSDEPDPYDEVICPKCECNAWEVFGREKQVNVTTIDDHRRKVKAHRRMIPLRCLNDQCGHQWKQTIIEPGHVPQAELNRRRYGSGHDSRYSSPWSGNGFETPGLW